MTRHSGKFVDYLEIVGRIEETGAKLTIHHDLCLCDLEHALRFAKQEECRGIRATYLPLHDDASWRHPRFLYAMEHLRQMGHRIGLHHDAIGTWLRDLTPPADTLRRAVEHLRKTGPVHEAAAHGAPACYHDNGTLRYVNTEVWKEHDSARNVGAAGGWKFDRVSLADLGLTERYFGDHTAYLSDSGGAFHGWYRAKLPIPFERYPEIDVGLKVIDRLTPEDRVVVLAHPVWTTKF